MGKAGECHASGLTIQKIEMLLTYSVCTFEVPFLDSGAICCLEWIRHCDVAWPKLMGCVRGKSTENNMVLMAALQDLEGFMGPNPSMVRSRGRPFASDLV